MLDAGWSRGGNESKRNDAFVAPVAGCRFPIAGEQRALQLRYLCASVPRSRREKITLAGTTFLPFFFLSSNSRIVHCVFGASARPLSRRGGCIYFAGPNSSVAATLPAVSNVSLG